MSAFFGSLFLLSSGGGAQDACSSLSVTWNGESSTLSTSLTGATPESLTVVMVGRHEGTITLPDGLSALGLGYPIFRVMGGVSDPNGALSSSRVLRRAPSGITLHFQAITLGGVVPPENKPSGRGGRRGGRRGGPRGGGPLENATLCISNVSSVDFP